MNLDENFSESTRVELDKGFLSNEISIIIGDEYQIVNLNPRSNGINPKNCIERKANCFFEFFVVFDIPLFSHQVVKRLPADCRQTRSNARSVSSC